MQGIRLGSIGFGQHAQRAHAAVFDAASVTAMYDPSPESVEQAQRAGVTRICGSAEELVALSDIDAVLIMTPDETHPALLELAVQAGKPVLCEKPLAIDEAGLETVRRALVQADEQGTLVASCHPRRDRHNRDLPYGWVAAQLPALEQRFGRLRRIGLNSTYPMPGRAWKLDRSFLADKFIHDIDYLRFLKGTVPFTAERLADSHDHYEVRGTLELTRGDLEFDCLGTRLHSARDEFIEIITLSFQWGECLVYTKTGIVRLRDRRTGEREELRITPMIPASYDRMFGALMEDFVRAVGGGTRLHTTEDLLTITAAVVGLCGTSGYYRSH